MTAASFCFKAVLSSACEPSVFTKTKVTQDKILCAQMPCGWKHRCIGARCSQVTGSAYAG